MTLDEAVAIIAQDILAHAAEGTQGWENYPDIGEDDWERVMIKVDQLATPWPDRVAFLEAHEFMENRAKFDSQREV